MRISDNKPNLETTVYNQSKVTIDNIISNNHWTYCSKEDVAIFLDGDYKNYYILLESSNDRLRFEIKDINNETMFALWSSYTIITNDGIPKTMYHLIQRWFVPVMTKQEVLKIARNN